MSLSWSRGDPSDFVLTGGELCLALSDATFVGQGIELGGEEVVAVGYV